MSRSTIIYRRGGQAIEFNMTPMIDVTFQLIIFFILAGTFASMDVVRLIVPTVHGGRPVEVHRLPDKLVINVPPLVEAPESEPAAPVADGAPVPGGPARAWLVAGTALRPGDTAGLVRLLQRERAALAARQGQAGAELQVEVRADKSIDFAHVAPVLSAVSQAGFARVHYVAYGGAGGD